jgi:hypothetical protein
VPSAGHCASSEPLKVMFPLDFAVHSCAGSWSIWLDICFLLSASQVWCFICGGAFDQLEAISPEFKTLSSSWYCYHRGAQAGSVFFLSFGGLCQDLDSGFMEASVF